MQTMQSDDHRDSPTTGGGGGGGGGGGDGDESGSGGDSAGASIAERRAVKCGFKAEKISPVTSPLQDNDNENVEDECSAAFFTIPPGMSPTALLDSPIFLHNSQSSPTTGTFSLPHLTEHSLLSSLNPLEDDKGEIAGSVFGFKSHQVPDFSTLDNDNNNNNKVSSPANLAQRADVDYQALFNVDLPIDFEFSAEFSEECTVKNSAVDSIIDVKVSNIVIGNDNCSSMPLHCSDKNGEKTSSLFPKEPSHEEDSSAPQNHTEGDLKETNPSVGIVRTSEDGYNWRKYGQKQVKGSEYPRSYYKCTHPNCQVKKKVERSYDGQITEIIYKGAHSHPKPQPSRRPSSLSLDEASERNEASLKAEGGPVWRNIEDGLKDMKLGNEWRAECQEKTSPTSGVTDLSDPLSPPTQGKSLGAIDSSDTPELSSALANQEEIDDGATQGNILPGDEAYGEESQSKRRKTESSVLESNLTSRAVREPRVVVQIESEVDILDDGYRWRKYGQKVVKGNPNPRSYYKCTNAGCLVRKHVERASHNLKCVITTYEGKHNHEVPAARNNNNNHVNLTNGGLPSVSAATQPPFALSRTSHIPKPEPQIQDVAPRFGRKLPESTNEYMRPSYLGSFNNDMKLASQSLYLMKFPPLQNPYSSYANVTPDFPMPLPWNLPASPNISLAGFDYNTNEAKPPIVVPPYISGQRLKDSGNMRFVRPKQEQKDDHLYEACLPSMDHANASSSSLYQQVMGNFHS